jgi:hypothetical protein
VAPGTYPLADGRGPVQGFWAPDDSTSGQQITGTVTIGRATYDINGVPVELSAVVRGTRRSPQGEVPVSGLVLLRSVPTGLPGYLAADPASITTPLPLGFDQTFPISVRNLGGAALTVPSATVVSRYVSPPQTPLWSLVKSCSGTALAAGASCAAGVRIAWSDLSDPRYPYAAAVWGSGDGAAEVALRAERQDPAVAPTASLTVPSSVYGSATVRITSSDPQVGDTVSLRCRLDAGPFVACGTSWALSNLAWGGHTVTVYATDPAGHMSQWVRAGFTSTLPSLSASLVADGASDLLARRSTGALAYYRGNGRGGFAGTSSVGAGFQEYSQLLSPGDFTGDGRADVIGRRSNGDLVLHSGLSTQPGRRIGTGWNAYNALVTPGDFSGDGRADLVVRTSDGALYLYRGNGTGGFSGSRVRIGSGWQGFSRVVGVGDLSGDGHADLAAVTSGGDLYLYRGDGRGAFLSGRTRIGTGWAGFTAVVGVGDFSGDHRADLVARTRSGDLYLYKGNGRGGFQSGATRIGTGWSGFTALVGLR